VTVAASQAGVDAEKLPGIRHIIAVGSGKGGALGDTRGRLLRDLRISVTDRCNFRCTYCMPKSVFDKDYHFLQKSEFLSFEEITRMTRLFVAHGVDFPVADVLKGINAAHEAGFASIKINMVVKKGVNDHDIVAMARRFKGSGHIVRFIEFMDVGASNGWRMNDVVPSAEIVRRISDQMPLIEVEPNYTGEVAERWAYADGSGEIGVISSVTQAFCSTCTRARLSTDGKLYTCLFAQSGHDLRALIRSGKSDTQIAAAVGLIWNQREDRYSEIRTEETARTKKIEMSYIGG
jgi:molybdenum cofactor biosynthesis enzyme MoaA